MSVVDCTPAQFAALMRSEDLVILPVAVSGFVYGVIRGSEDSNIYRVAVA